MYKSPRQCNIDKNSYTIIVDFKPFHALCDRNCNWNWRSINITKQLRTDGGPYSTLFTFNWMNHIISIDEVIIHMTLKICLSYVNCLRGICSYVWRVGGLEGLSVQKDAYRSDELLLTEQHTKLMGMSHINQELKFAQEKTERWDFVLNNWDWRAVTYWGTGVW